MASVDPEDALKAEFSPIHGGRSLLVTPTSVGDLDCLHKFHELRELRRWPAPRQPQQGGSGGAVSIVPMRTTGTMGTLRVTQVTRERGTLVHAVLRRVYDPRQAPLPCLKHVPVWVRGACLEQGWPSDLLGKDDLAGVEEVVRTYGAWDVDAAATVGVEVEGQCRVKGIPAHLKATLDRVLIRPSAPTTVVVREYGTPRRRVTLEQAFIKLAVARKLYPSCRQVVLELDRIGPAGEVERETLEGRTLAGMVDVMREKVSRYASAPEWPEEPGPACAFCVLKQGCAAYQGGNESPGAHEDEIEW